MNKWLVCIIENTILILAVDAEMAAAQLSSINKNKMQK